MILGENVLPIFVGFFLSFIKKLIKIGGKEQKHRVFMRPEPKGYRGVRYKVLAALTVINVIVFGYTQIFNFYFHDFTQIILPSENFREKGVKNRRLQCQIEDNKYLPSDFLAILTIKIAVLIYSVIPDFVDREFLSV